ncbi:MAG: hypothetical protein ABIJ09_20050 [Pseudomonadota bacterium]
MRRRQVYSTHRAFRPHAINVQRKDAVIKMRQVQRVEKFGLIPNGLKVVEKDGTVWEFRVGDRDKVAALIKDAAGL